MKTIIGLAALIIGTASAMAAEPAMTTDHGGAKIYTDMKGMTLYTFDKDAAGKSNCNAECAMKWPPFKAEADAKAEGEWSVVEREDGSKMWAYDGKPLYYFAQDKAAGDMKGDGMGGAWHLVKAD
jgi:predicted lipoprotein with Yx(FWY)xxD motif